MARIPRVVVPHHGTQRGSHQKDVFFANSDREMCLTLLVEYSRKHALQIEGYCLMTNHVHLVVVPERSDSLAKAIGQTHNDYSRWLHVRQRLVESADEWRGETASTMRTSRSDCGKRPRPGAHWPAKRM